MNVCILVGHPRPGSYGAALAQAYAEGARAAGCAVEVIDLATLRFDPDVHPPSPTQQALEPGLQAALTALERAEHWLVVMPAWWGVGPARLWGFFDRVLLPGRAFRECPDGRYEGLLGPRTAHLLLTMDMPPWVYRLVFKAPGLNGLKRTTLGLCGVRTTHVECLGPVTHSTPQQRATWLQRARHMGFSLSKGVHALDRWHALKSWLRALRLQFYPMTWMAYTAGALLAAAGGALDRVAYGLGYALLFALEAATVFINDRVDAESDRRNQHHGPFTGGSRVLVDGALTPARHARGIAVALLASAMLAVLLLGHVGTWPLAAAVALLAVLALGYTAPPLKLAWRGWGELTVGLTHSLCVIGVGYLAQGGAPRDAAPWLLGLPLMVAVVPAIILAGVPDEPADRAVGKRTLVVRLGPRRAVWLALVLAATAWLLALGVTASGVGVVPGLLAWLLPLAGALLLPLAWQLVRLARRPVIEGRIDGPLVLALNYLTLFALVPLWALWAAR